MALRTILTAPDPLLLRISANVANIDEDIRQLVADMFETMYAANGIGLAAAQIGVQLRIAVTDVREDDEAQKTPRVFINPVIEPLTNEQSAYREGCLSVPKIYAEVTRPTHIRITYRDLAGVQHTEELSGLQAVCIQHEVDHMQGILFIDHLPKLQRSMYLEKCEKQNKRKGSFSKEVEYSQFPQKIPTKKW